MCDYNIDNDRELIIYTWGKKVRQRLNYKVDKNFSVEMLNIKSNTNESTSSILKKHNGKAKQVEDLVLNNKKFIKIVCNMLYEIEKNNYKCISINCLKGRHRSVATAEFLKKNYYPNAYIKHLELN